MNRILDGPKVKTEGAMRGRLALSAWLSRLGYYALALLFVAVAALVRWALADVLSVTPFLVFYLAWVAAAVLGGLGPGLLATVASWLCIDFLFDPIPGHIGIGDPLSIVRLGICLVGGLAVSLVGEKMRRARIRERRQAVDLADANAALRESEARFRTMADGAPNLIWVTDAEGTRIFANRQYLKYFGISPEEMKGGVWKHVIHPDSVPTYVNSFMAALQERRPFVAEARVKRADGQWRWIESYAEPRLSLEGEFLGFVGISQDITDRKQAEEMLRESEEKYRRIVETATEAIMLVDTEAQIVFVNGRWSEIFGYSRKEAGRMTFFDLVFPEDIARMNERWESRKRGQQESYEFRLRRKDGSPVWVLMGVGPRFGPEGGFLGMLVMMADITQRKQMEEELRRLNDLLGERVHTREEQLRDTVDSLQAEVVRRISAEDELLVRSRMLEAFFQHTITPLAFLDRQFNYVRVNQAYAEAARKEPEQFVGKNYFALQPNDEDRSIFEEVLQTQQPYHAYARPLRFGDEPQTRTRYWNCLLTPLLDARGTVQSLVLNLEDVTERQKAFEELEHRAWQLQKLTLELTEAEERERTRIAGILHDDLQQVLAAAKFRVGLLSSRVRDDADSQEMVGQARDLLADAITKSRSLSHELRSPALSQADLGAAFEWLAEEMQKKHGLAVRWETGARIDVASAPLRILLYQAAQELLFNVIKHGGVQEATLGLRHHHGCLRLSVSDQGRGFDPADPDCRLGFGLLGIRERIELLGGRMTIRSAPGKGSTFILVVPAGETASVTSGAERELEG